MDVHEHNMRVFYGDYDTTLSFNERVQIHKNGDNYYIVANGTLQKIYRNPTMILILNNMSEHFKTVGYWTIPKKYVQANEDELFMITEENGEYFYDAVGKVMKWTFSKISLEEHEIEILREQSFVKSECAESKLLFKYSRDFY